MSAAAPALGANRCTAMGAYSGLKLTNRSDGRLATPIYLSIYRIPSFFRRPRPGLS